MKTSGTFLLLAVAFMQVLTPAFAGSLRRDLSEYGKQETEGEGTAELTPDSEDPKQEIDDSVMDKIKKQMKNMKDDTGAESEKIAAKTKEGMEIGLEKLKEKLGLKEVEEEDKENKIVEEEKEEEKSTKEENGMKGDERDLLGIGYGGVRGFSSSSVGSVGYATAPGYGLGLGYAMAPSYGLGYSLAPGYALSPGYGLGYGNLGYGTASGLGYGNLGYGTASGLGYGNLGYGISSGLAINTPGLGYASAPGLGYAINTPGIALGGI